MGHEVTGTDLTPDMIRYARELAEEEKAGCQFLIMDGESLDFEDGTFDVVISRNLTWTLPDTARAYKEWLRVLKKGGILLNFDANYGAVNFADTSKLPKNHTHNKLGLDIDGRMRGDQTAASYQQPYPSCLGCGDPGNLGVERLSVDFSVSRKIYTVKDEFYNPDALFALFAVKG